MYTREIWLVAKESECKDLIGCWRGKMQGFNWLSLTGPLCSTVWGTLARSLLRCPGTRTPDQWWRHRWARDAGLWGNTARPTLRGRVQRRTRSGRTSSLACGARRTRLKPNEGVVGESLHHMNSDIITYISYISHIINKPGTAQVDAISKAQK